MDSFYLFHEGDWREGMNNRRITCEDIRAIHTARLHFCSVPYVAYMLLCLLEQAMGYTWFEHAGHAFHLNWQILYLIDAE